jgi:hypothetical protein
MNNPDMKPEAGSKGPGGGSGEKPIHQNWWFWIGILVLVGGFLLYVRTWTRADRLDFTPKTNPPPPIAAPAQK